MSGTASLNVDYTTAGRDFQRQITFAAGASTKTVTLTAIQEIPLDDGEVATLTLAAGPLSGAGVYTIGAPNAGSVTIANAP